MDQNGQLFQYFNRDTLIAQAMKAIQNKRYQLNKLNRQVQLVLAYFQNSVFFVSIALNVNDERFCCSLV